MDQSFVRSRTTDLALRDGSRVRLRPIVPEDRSLLLEAFERLSEESKYRRFMGGIKSLTSHNLAYLTELDYVNHFAWIAFAPDAPGTPGVAVARYVRLRDEPEAAEAAVTVVDDWQGKGLGTLMLDALGAVAVENGIRRFRAYVLVENRPMLEILRSMGTRIAVDSPGVLRADIDLPEQMKRLEGTALYEALRSAARGELPVLHRWEPRGG
jgi:GNAT superfamily N-acetyltransferase